MVLNHRVGVQAMGFTTVQKAVRQIHAINVHHNDLQTYMCGLETPECTNGR